MNEPDAVKALGALAFDIGLKIYRLLVVAEPSAPTPRIIKARSTGLAIKGLLAGVRRR
jgi:hypothetical protein